MTQDRPIFPVAVTLTADFLVGDTTITVSDATQLPDAPNEASINAGDYLYVTYAGISGNTLTGVSRNDGSYKDDVSAGAEISTYQDMRTELRAIQSSSLPNPERLESIANMLGWNEMLEAWVDAVDEFDEETGEYTGDKIYRKPDGTIIRFDADAQVLYTKKLERYNTSYLNNMKVVW